MTCPLYHQQSQTHTPVPVVLPKSIKLLAVLCSLFLVACGNNQSGNTSADAGNFRCQADTCEAYPEDGEPLRIVSTSVTITGTLLAIDAPVIASAATQANTAVSDDQGFFKQWSDVAKSRNIIPLYQGLPNAEAIAAQQPDLIIVSATGGDSAMKIIEQLKEIAPVWVLHYDDKSWQELAIQLGKKLQIEANAETLISRFNTQMAEVKARITLPSQPTTAMVYYEDGRGANVWTENSAQGKFLIDLGFELAAVPEHAQGPATQGTRKDIIQVSGETFADALTGNSILLFSADESLLLKAKQNKFLKQIPAVMNNEIFAVGSDTFRLDYYSSSNLLNRISTQFGQAI
jgi:iron complex transport system substrate-binding protein